MKLFVLAVCLILIGTVGFFAIMFTGPHMIVQPHILAFERSMPMPPQGIVAVEEDRYALQPGEGSSGPKNPLPDTRQNRERGKVYYSYYCVFCHGENGQGDGPVGYSYMPAPSDLHAPEILGVPDAELFRRMLSGTGHDPVLVRIVPPEHRWYLVTYIRALGRTARVPSENQGRQVAGKGAGVTH